MKSLQDFIFVVRDVVPAELRTKILQEYAKSDEWKSSVVGRNYDLVKEIRDVDEIVVSQPTTIEKNSVVRKTIDDELFVCANAVLTKYTANYKDFTKIHTEKDEGYTLLRYQAAQFIAEHTDAGAFTLFRRAVSCSFAINDDYEGGEWSFFGGVHTQRLNAGDAILFPSNFLFPHSIRPVTSGVRYSVVTWFG
jgi:predicted 2-oxoglutarate/Fe(II)-dependent dioxygenase YbiX